jgi:phage FluMu protein Com
MKLVQFRCPHDGKLLLKVSEGAALEIRCPRCKHTITAEHRQTPEE